MTRLSRFRSTCVLALPLAVAGLFATPAQADSAKEPPTMHYLLLAIDSDDAAAMKLGLHNAENAKRFYDAQGASIEVEVVAYGAGITMLRADKSPVADLIAEAQKEIPDLALSMCGNAKAGAEKREGHEVPLLPGVRVVPAGIVRVMHLEEQGWSYVKP